MPQGKLARFKEQNRRLRAENRDLQSTVVEANGHHNPSTLRKFVGLAIKGGAAYGAGRAFVKMQQAGWMPQRVPVDILGGAVAQGVTAFFHGWISGIIEEIGDGVTEGGLGRLAAYHQLEASEIDGRRALLLPGSADEEVV